MRISIIVAMAENRVIGNNNRLPWHIPEDLQYFKRRTMGKAVVMGRKTHDSIGKPLPGRTNIVVTRQKGWRAEGVHTANNIESALMLARRCSPDEVMIIGGADLYAQLLPQTDRLYITQVHASFNGDAFFPAVNAAHWCEVGREDFRSEMPGKCNYSFVVLDRVTGNTLC